MKRLDQQFEFIKEVDKEKFIHRQTYLTGGTRRENDAEHAWHTALMTILLSEYANEPIDVLKTVSMLLIHDIVEIDAGDTFAYDSIQMSSKEERETKAAKRLFGLLPPDQAGAMLSLWNEFEAGETPEAEFARAMDNIQPNMQNDMTNGKLWTERNIRLSQILQRNQVTPDGSKTLWDYSFDSFIHPYVARGCILDDTNETVAITE